MALCVSGDRIAVRILNVKRIINTTRGSQKLLLAQGMRFKVAITFEGEGLWRTCIWVSKPTTNGMCGDGNVAFVRAPVLLF